MKAKEKKRSYIILGNHESKVGPLKIKYNRGDIIQLTDEESKRPEYENKLKVSTDDNAVLEEATKKAAQIIEAAKKEAKELLKKPTRSRSVKNAEPEEVEIVELKEEPTEG